MTPDLVRLLVVDGVSQAGACELCAGDGEPLTAAVVVQHMRGGEVRFAACARCARALHRVVGAIGDQGRFRPVEAIDAGPVTSVQTPASTTVEPAVAPPELILESPHSLRGPGGTSYSVGVHGQARPPVQPRGGALLGDRARAGVLRGCVRPRSLMLRPSHQPPVSRQ
jgi:hypothetical protein